MNKSKWISPVSFEAQTMAKALRQSLEELNFKFSRDTDHKHYSKTMIIIPMPKFSYVYRFIVEEPSEFVIDTYDTVPTHSGKMPFLEIKSINEKNKKDIQKVLAGVVKNLPREPWKFTGLQRLQHGYFIPEFRRARKAWKKLGIS